MALASRVDHTMSQGPGLAATLGSHNRPGDPSGGILSANGELLWKMGGELAIVSIYVIGGACASVFAIKRVKLTFPAIYGGLMLVAGWFFSTLGARTSYLNFAAAVILLVFALLNYIRHSRKSGAARSGD
jgi:hypothetical protein